jgi:phosphate transport system substrate-binding protein
LFALAVAFLAVLSVWHGDRTLTVTGSQTMVVLGQRWAEEYMKFNPGTAVRVRGGGLTLEQL